MNKEPVLVLENIYKDYRQGKSIVEVLKDVNIKVMPGEMIAIVGASGSGKSTLLQIAGLLDFSDKGSVRIGGILGNQMSNFKNAHQIRLNNIGFIYQYHHLLKDFNAMENVAMPLIIKGQDKCSALKEAAELLNSLGLGNRLYNLPGELSGGQQQRVAIGRALINHPKIILADEPTGNLDSVNAQEIFNLFLKRAEKYNVAIIMATHNIALAKKMHKLYKLDYNLS